MNEWKNQCVGLQKTCVSKRTVTKLHVLSMYIFSQSPYQAVDWVRLKQQVVCMFSTEYAIELQHYY